MTGALSYRGFTVERVLGRRRWAGVLEGPDEEHPVAYLTAPTLEDLCVRIDDYLHAADEPMPLEPEP